MSWANWFGGVYITESNFFPQFAVDAPSYLDLYPGIRAEARGDEGVPASTAGARSSAARSPTSTAGRSATRAASRHHLPGQLDFIAARDLRRRDAKTDETQFFFHWDYLNETVKAQLPAARRPGRHLPGRDPRPDAAAEVSQAIDATFRNSLAETLTETEKAFQLGFVSMTEAILFAIQAVSFVVILIIMAVMANTMAMTARERMPNTRR